MSRLSNLFLAGAFALNFSACDDAYEDSAPEADLGASSLIYGVDDRLQSYQITDADEQAALGAVVGQVAKRWVTRKNDGTYQVDTSLSLRDTMGVCSSEPFADEPASMECSGVLVGPDLVATAGHCVSTSNCSKKAYIFGFRMDSANTVRSRVAANDYYTCAAVTHRSTGSADYALVRLDRPVVGHTPAQVASGAPSVGDPLVLMGHPEGLPVKIAGGATVKNVSSKTFGANTDSYSGNSGSPVFNENTWEVEGLLVNGNTDFVRRGGCYVSNTCANSGCPGFETVTRASTFKAFVP
jgi:hypothetical protein